MILWQLLAQTIGLIFFGAAISKVVDRRHFGAFLRRIGLRGALEPAASIAVISAESIVGIGLISGIALGATAPAAFAISAGFAAVLVAQVRSHPNSGCGCFGVIDRATPAPISVIRALVLLIGTGLLLLRPTEQSATLIFDPLLLAEAMAGATAYE